MCYDTKWYILRYLYFGVFRAKSMPDQTHNKIEYIYEMVVWTSSVNVCFYQSES